MTNFAGLLGAREDFPDLALLNDVGKITTVTQRDVATETQNLIAIMQLGGLSVEELGAALGQVTAAGNNSSTAIAAILDALNIALPGAKLAGTCLGRSLPGVVCPREAPDACGRRRVLRPESPPRATRLRGRDAEGLVGDVAVVVEWVR